MRLKRQRNDGIGPFTREAFQRHQDAFAAAAQYDFTYTRVFDTDDDMSAWLRRIAENEAVRGVVDALLDQEDVVTIPEAPRWSATRIISIPALRRRIQDVLDPRQEGSGS